MKSARWIGFGCLLLTVVSGRAKDYTDDWTFLAIIQPQASVGEDQEPDARFRRIRGVATGPLTRDLKAKFQVNYSPNTNVLSLLDAYLDYTPVKYPFRLNLQGGLMFPAFAKEGQTFANTVNFAYIIASPRLFDRTTGAQATVGYDDFALTAGVFNGVQDFEDSNELPNYVFAFTAVEPWFDARAWAYVGKDGRPGAETDLELYGAEITNARWGRFGGNLVGIVGERYGRQMMGGYVEAMYQLTDRDLILGKADLANLNRDSGNGARERYTLSYHRRFTDWMTSKWDLEYDAELSRVTALVQGDLRF